MKNNSQIKEQIQFKNITPDMLKIVRKYLYIDPSKYEPQMKENLPQIQNNRKSLKSNDLKDISDQINIQLTPKYKSQSNTYRFQGKDKIEQNPKNYEQLRDPKFWIQRSLSEQMNNLKGLNPELVDYRFKDEDIRLQQEKSLGSDTKKIIIPIKRQSDSPTTQQMRNQLLDMKVLNDQWTISKPHNVLTENNKEDEPYYENQQSYDQQILKKYTNAQYNTYTKYLKTEDQNNQKRSWLVNRQINKRLKTEQLQDFSKEELIRLSRREKTQNSNYQILNKLDKLEYYEDVHNFVNYPSNQSNGQYQFNKNNFNIQPSQSVQKLLLSHKNHSLNNKKYYTLIDPIQQSQQQIYYNNENPYNKKLKQNIQTLNSYSSQIQLSNKNQIIYEKYSKFNPDGIQLTPISIGLQKNLFSSQKFLTKNYNPQDEFNSHHRMKTHSFQDQNLCGNINLPQDDLVLEEQSSFIDLNELFKQNDEALDENKKDEEINKKEEVKNDKFKGNYKIKKYSVKKEEPQIIRLGKAYSIYFDQQFISKLQKEQQQCLRISAYRDFVQMMNFTNKIYMSIPEEKNNNHPIYKAFVGKGNNQMLIRMVIKQRWWWVITDQKDDNNINLVWTQLRKNDVLSTIKSLRSELINSSRISRQQSLQQPLSQSQQSPSNISNQSSQFILSPSTSQTQFNQSSNSNNNILQYNQNASQANINIMQSSQSLFGSQVESTTDESTIVSTQNLVILPKQIIKLTKNEQNLKKLINQQDFNILSTYFKNRQGKKFNAQAFLSPKELQNITKEQEYRIFKDSTTLKVHNHLSDNFHLSNKKALFYNMRSYYESNQQNVFDYLPLTFHIQDGKKDKEYVKFVNHFNSLKDQINNKSTINNNQNTTNNIVNITTTNNQNKKEQNIWIIKPGEITNRGFGIKVLSDLDQIEDIIESNEFHKTGLRKTYIIQKYIEYPLLYFKRKFDIRCYYLLTSTNGYLKGYWYQDGYIRTASKEFTTKNLGKMIHLTNDAVQKKDDQYGKYEKGNKVSYDELDKYITSQYPEKDFFNTILPQMKVTYYYIEIQEIGRDTMKAVYGKIDPDKKESTIEVFGLDFMIDENLRVWLIEVNTNPALDICCPLLSKIIPAMIENTFRIAIDPLFPPPQANYHKNFNFENMLENNKYELIFDEIEDSKLIKMIGKDTNLNWQMIEEEQEENEEDIIPE